MAHWLFKIADDEYVEWSTNTDSPVSATMNREEALAYSADVLGSEEAAVERLRHTDRHLCSCTARLGENVEIRNDRAVMVGGGRLAFSFDSYDRVAEYLTLDGHRYGSLDEIRAEANA